MSQASVGAEAIRLTRELFERFEDSPVVIRSRGNILDLDPGDAGVFAVTLYNQGHLSMVAAERWHAKFDDPMQAAFCALWLFTPYYRIVHEYKGGILVSTWIERYEATGWEGMDPVYFMNPEHEPSWRLVGEETYRRQYVQQAILPPPAPYEEFAPGVELDEYGLPLDFRDGKWSVIGNGPMGIDLY